VPFGKPFPCDVVTAYDPGQNFRFSFSRVRGRYAGI